LSSTFEPKTFYDLAIYVKNQLFHMIPQDLTQAADRTCISRVYYAVFLSFRDKILALPFRSVELKRRIQRTQDAHAIVAETIRVVDPSLGDYIVNLRILRNRADYRTNIVSSSNDVFYAFKIANEIFSKLTNIVGRIKESDVDLAWSRIQRERQKERFHI